MNKFWFLILLGWGPTLCHAQLIQPVSQETEESILKITIGQHNFTATLEDNRSAQAFKELLLKGALTLSMKDYGGFEKVGDLGIHLPQSDTLIRAQPGDVILYQGRQITIYYDHNTWNFTKIAKIHEVSHLKEILGSSSVTAIFSIEE